MFIENIERRNEGSIRGVSAQQAGTEQQPLWAYRLISVPGGAPGPPCGKYPKRKRA